MGDCAQSYRLSTRAHRGRAKGCGAPGLSFGRAKARTEAGGGAAMETWLDDLHVDPPWLLHGSEPTVRHLALRHLLDRPADNPEVRRAREEAMLMTLVPIRSSRR